MRETLPDIEDDHLYTIESHVHKIIKEKNLCIKSMMNNEKCTTHSPTSKNTASIEGESEIIDETNSDNESTLNPSGHSSKVANKKLKCVKV